MAKAGLKAGLYMDDENRHEPRSLGRAEYPMIFWLRVPASPRFDSGVPV